MKKAVMLCLVILLFSFFAFQEQVTKADARMLMQCARGEDVGGCGKYPPVLIKILSLFSSRDEFVIYFFLIVATILVPLTLVKITGQEITAWFYFSATNFYFALISAGFYAQTLAVMLTFTMLLTKRWYLRIGLLLVASFTHTTGFLMASTFWFVLSLQEQSKQGFFVCSPFFGKETPEIFNTPLLISSKGFSAFSVGTLLSVMIKRLPFFFLFPALLTLWKRKEIALLMLFAVFFGAGLLIHDRGFYMAALPMVIGLSYYYKDEKSTLIKGGILIISIAVFFFNLFQVYSLITSC